MVHMLNAIAGMLDIDMFWDTRIAHVAAAKGEVFGEGVLGPGLGLGTACLLASGMQ